VCALLLLTAACARLMSVSLVCPAPPAGLVASTSELDQAAVTRAVKLLQKDGAAANGSTP
jgi:hypothetical protein